MSKAPDIHAHIALYNGAADVTNSTNFATLTALSTRKLLDGFTDWLENIARENFRASGLHVQRTGYLLYLATNLIDMNILTELGENTNKVAREETERLTHISQLLVDKANIALGNDRTVAFNLVQAQVQFIHVVATEAQMIAERNRRRVLFSQEAAKTVKAVISAHESLNVLWGKILDSRQSEAHTHDLRTILLAYDSVAKLFTGIAGEADKLSTNAMRRDSAIRMLLGQVEHPTTELPTRDIYPPISPDPTETLKNVEEISL